MCKMAGIWIEKETIDGVTKYWATDGIWCSKEYDNIDDARKRMRAALWGEGLNTI